MEGRLCPCCYDSKWSEITARGDWGAVPCWYDFILSEISAKDSECWWHSYQKDPLRRKHRVSPSSKGHYDEFINKLYVIAYWRRDILCFCRKGSFWYECHEHSLSLADISRNMKSYQQGTVPQSPLAVISLHLES